MPLTVLTDDDVRRVLDTLDREDILNLHKTLVDALHSYSTSTDDIGACASNQPSRISIKHPDGNTTLFMPATSDDALGVKIVTLSPSSGSDNNNTLGNVSSLTSSARSMSLQTTSSKSRSSSPVGTPRSGTPVSGHPSHRSSTFSPSQSPSTSRTSSSLHSQARPDILASDGTPIFDPSDPNVPLEPPSSTSPAGSITLLTATGQPRALINASTLTAFRTALASTLLLKGRAHLHTLTVFGAGQQAYWHIHLALLLRGDEIHHLNVINRSFPRAQRLLMGVGKHPALGFSEKLRPQILTPMAVEYERLLKEHVRDADAIFCCTPATQPLFPAGHLTNPEGRKKARYIVAIGSYEPHMQELHEDILRKAVAPPKKADGKGGARHAGEGGAIVVDSIEGAMRESGEIIKAGIGGSGVVELGELVMLKRGHWEAKSEREREEAKQRAREGYTASNSYNNGSGDGRGNGHGNGGSSGGGGHHHHGIGHGLGHFFHKSHHSDSGAHSHPVDVGDGGLLHWLQRGNVIYKSVGIGLMDVVVGMDIVRLAEQRGIGTTIRDF